MKLLSTPLVRYLAPMLMGYCVAAATEAGSVAEMLGLIALAGAFALVSFPAGIRLISRLSKAEA